jgi:error-prone DNA polymerase
MAEGRLEKLPVAGGAINIYARRLLPLVTPDDDAAGVVELAQRRAAAAAAEAPAAAQEAGDAAAGVLADFRGVAPAVQSFAAGRRR